MRRMTLWFLTFGNEWYASNFLGKISISNALTLQVWNDSRLQWDAKEYGVDVLRVPPELVWRPDTTLYNG